MQGPGHLKFVAEVLRCVRDRRNEELLALLRCSAAARMLRAGFPPDRPQWPRQAFAQVCMAAGNTEALRAVLDAGILGITLHECCMFQEDDEDVPDCTVLDLPAFAVDQLDPAALLVALEFAPHHPSFARIHPKRLGTLHYAALVKALASDRDSATRAARCCTVFIEHREHAPCDSDTDSDGLRRMFLVGSYDYNGTADVAEPLLRAYIAAALFDVDSAMRDPNSVDHAVCTPLAAAVGYGNATLARTLIDVGCNLDAARGAFPDVLAMAAARVANGARRAGETHAAVAQALMRRRIHVHAPDAACINTSSHPGGATPAARRTKFL